MTDSKGFELKVGDSVSVYVGPVRRRTNSRYSFIATVTGFTPTRIRVKCADFQERTVTTKDVYKLNADGKSVWLFGE